MSALLDDCCEKLAFLGTISPDVNEHKMEESNRIGDEMSRIIAEQRQLEDRFEQLIQQRSELKASSNKKRAEENKIEIKEVATQLKLKTKLLCRNLKVRVRRHLPFCSVACFCAVCAVACPFRPPWTPPLTVPLRFVPPTGQPERCGEPDEASGRPQESAADPDADD